MVLAPRSTNAQAQSRTPLTKEQKDAAPWLSKLPMTNPHDRSTVAELRMRSVYLCFALLWKHPSLAHTCQMWIEDRLAEPNEVDAETHFDFEPASIGNLPTDWLCSYLIDMRVGWNEKLLGRAKAYDKRQIMNLMCGYLNVSPQMKLGDGAADKLVVKRAFDKRRAQISSRFAKVKSPATAASIVDEVGLVKFGAFGMYKLAIDPETKCAKQVAHMPSADVATITSKNIDCEWYMDHNYSGANTIIQLTGSKTDRHQLQTTSRRTRGRTRSPPWSATAQHGATT